MGEHDDGTHDCRTHEWRIKTLEGDVKTLWGKLEAVRGLLIGNLVGVILLLLAALVSFARGGP